jgi:hypothetical protein
MREFAYFAHFKPVARIGYSIDIFHLTEQDIAAWRSATKQRPDRRRRRDNHPADAGQRRSCIHGVRRFSLAG